jgi:hypothetical protein
MPWCVYLAMIVPPSSLCRTEHSYASNQDCLNHGSCYPMVQKEYGTGFLEPLKSTANFGPNTFRWTGRKGQNTLRGVGRKGQHHSSTADVSTDISFCTETKTVYICTRDNCNKRYSRLQDLRRHCRGFHLQDHQFKCRALGCERAVRGFPRKDKRDIHEKKMHVDIGDGILL